MKEQSTLKIKKSEGEIKMKRYLLVIVIILLFLSFAPSQSASDAIRIRQDEIGFGARDIAMGGNGVVSSVDYSAIYWNPAGLASLRKTQVSAEFSHLRFDNSAMFAGNLYEMQSSYTRFRNFGIAVPLPTARGSLVFGLGYNFVKDFDDYLYFEGFNTLSNGTEFELEDDNGNYDWYSFDKNVQQTEEVTAEGGLHQWSFAGALSLSPSLDVGATINFWSGREEYQLNFYQEDSENLYTVYPGDFHSYSLSQGLITNYQAFSLKLGSMFQLNRSARLGLSVELPTTFRITEDYTSSDELVFDDGYTDALEYEPSSWEYQVKTPFRFDGGIGLDLETIQLTAGLTYQDWRQTRFEKPTDLAYDADYQDLLDENQTFQRDYRETFNYHLGGEIGFPNTNLFLRGGYAYYPSPLKDADPERDKQVYSGGIGLRIAYGTYLDLTYRYSSWIRESEDVYTPGGTREDITENRIFLGFRYNF
jgi:long-subunit fatty acid transport protein